MTIVAKRATEYLKDYWLRAKEIGCTGIYMDDLLAGAKTMGEENLEHLMSDFYESEIFPIIDI